MLLDKICNYLFWNLNNKFASETSFTRNSFIETKF